MRLELNGMKGETLANKVMSVTNLKVMHVFLMGQFFFLSARTDDAFSVRVSS